MYRQGQMQSDYDTSHDPLQSDELIKKKRFLFNKKGEFQI
jgi:hypothetical protein